MMGFTRKTGIVFLVFLTLIIGVCNERVQGKPLFPFNDIEGTWAQWEIGALAEMGVFAGKGNGWFYPRDDITRAEFVKLILTAMAMDPEEKQIQTFKDVSSDFWYWGYIERAALEGLVQGSQGFCRPEELITREEAAIILVRAMGLEGLAKEFPRGMAHFMLLSFPDRGGISPWAFPYVALAVREDLVVGEPGKALEPARRLKREEAAVMIYRLIRWFEQ